MNIIKLETLPPPPKLKRMAAYARVSSGKETMLHSLSAQISYYSDYIGKHADWQYMGVFSDEYGIISPKGKTLDISRGFGFWTYFFI